MDYGVLERKRASYLGQITAISTSIDTFVIGTSSAQLLKQWRNSLASALRSHQTVIDNMLEHADGNEDKIAQDAERFRVAHCNALCALEDKADAVRIRVPIDDLPILQADMDAISFQFSEFELFKTEYSEESISVGELRTRVDDLKPIQSQFVASWSKLHEKGDANRKVELEGVRKTFVAAYYNLIGWFNDEIVRRVPSSAVSTSVSSSASASASNVKLPKTELCKFDGTPETWIPFRDSFKSMVHDVTTISGGTKFRYLKTSITDKHSPINHLLETDAGYEDAWKAVLEYYDDKRRIIDCHFNGMMTAKRMASESHEELQRLLNDFTLHTASIERMYSEKDLYRAFVAHLAIHRLDQHTRDLWETENKNKIPLWPDLQKFLKERRKTLSTMPAAKVTSKSSTTSTPNKNNNTNRSWRTSSVNAGSKSSSASEAHVSVNHGSSSAPPTSAPPAHAAPTSRICWMCNGDHRLNACNLFINLTIPQRIAKIKEWKICSNCFGSHSLEFCKSPFKCRTCQQKHHTMLHQELHAHAAPFTQAHVSCNSTRSENVITLFQTALVDIQDAHGEWRTVRAFLDSGSDSNYIRTDVAKALNLPMHNTHVEATGLGGSKSVVIKHFTSTTISNDDKSVLHDLTFLVTPKVTKTMPSATVDLGKLGIPANLLMADPMFHTPGKIDIMFGNDVYGKLLRDGRIELPSGPVLLNSIFGWLFSGSAPQAHDASQAHVAIGATTTTQCFHSTLGDLRGSIEKFYKLEDYRNDKRFLTDEEEHCEKVFEQTHQRLPTGRFTIHNPFKDNVDQLVTNYRSTLCQFLANEKRLQRNEPLREKYVDFMREYEELGHMSEIDVTQDAPGAPAYYFPHHPVEKPDSTTTSVRVVFNGSSKTASGLSLNDTLCVGPQIQNDVFTLTLRFRQYVIVIKADIAKMYRQIEVAHHQRRFQRIIWRDSPDDKLKIYELNTVTYGTASASFQSTRCLKQLGLENLEKYPKAAHEMIHSFYVDDLISGASSVPDAIALTKEIVGIVSSAEMKLRKFNSNNTKFLQSIPEEDRESPKADTAIKALGIKWDPAKDTIEFDVKPIEFGKITRRTILSEVARIYDPEGLLGPVTFRFKRFMKIVCQLSTSWDEKLPEKESSDWIDIARSFVELKRIEIPRHFLISASVSAQLHGFCDASDLGYGAAIYIRSQDSRGRREVHLVCSKSRIAPNEWKSTARLELCGAVVLSLLMQQVEKALTIPITKKFCWTDSAIVLHWLKKSPTQLQTFVANRVSEIQELSKDKIWRHIRTYLNPADDLSRGLMPEELIERVLWWHGPEFLMHSESQWPTSIVEIDPDEPSYAVEFKKVEALVLATTTTPETDDASSAHSNPFHQIAEDSSCTLIVKRKFAVARRFIHNARSKSTGLPRLTGKIQVGEMIDAELAIISIYQSIHFKEEFRRLSAGKAISSGSKIQNLIPIWDQKNKVIRVGGRLSQAHHCSEDQKHPIILPNCHFTKLIIREAHEKNLHAGQLATLGIVRLNYWPIRAKDIIRQVLHKCVKCFRARPKLIQQLMGSLPTRRVTPASAFFHTGVDYCGPFNIKVSSIRNAKSDVAYVALFVCLATKAIHLEIVSKLSTDAFLAAFDKFVSRRGLPHTMHSDHGLNFVGAKNVLQELYDFLAKPSTQAEIFEYFRQNEVEWHFIPPRAPTHGGLWEAGVKSMKYHFHRVAENCLLTFEEFDRLKAKIEAILNSRPLTSISDDPNDFSALTAGHFLIGRALVAKPERDLTSESINRLQRWERVVQLQQHFWQRWSQDYLHQLQVRTKNFKEEIPVSVGQLVLLHIDNCPPLMWPIGRITSIYPGKDGITRVASIRTAKSTYERPVTKIALLPIDPDDDQLIPPEDVRD